MRYRKMRVLLRVTELLMGMCLMSRKLFLAVYLFGAFCGARGEFMNRYN